MVLKVVSLNAVCGKVEREAVDEYFKNHNIHAFLNRIDYTGRLVIKK